MYSSRKPVRTQGGAGGSRSGTTGARLPMGRVLAPSCFGKEGEVKQSKLLLPTAAKGPGQSGVAHRWHLALGREVTPGYGTVWREWQCWYRPISCNFLLAQNTGTELRESAQLLDRELSSHQGRGSALSFQHWLHQLPKARPNLSHPWEQGFPLTQQVSGCQWPFLTDSKPPFLPAATEELSWHPQPLEMPEEGGTESLGAAGPRRCSAPLGQGERRVASGLGAGEDRAGQ